MMPYAPIHCRSHFSFLSGCLSPRAICSFAARIGAEYVGLTDINGLYGLPEFIREALRLGLQPLAGAVVAPDEKPLFTAYWKNRRGFGRLCGILSRVAEYRRPEGPRNPYDPLEDLLDGGWEDLWLLSADHGVLRRLAAGRRGELSAALVCGRPFAATAALARELGVRLLAVNDLVYLDKEDPAFLRLLRAMDGNVTLEDIPVSGLPGKEGFAVLPADMAAFFSAVPEALEAAGDLAARCAGSPFPGGYVFPRFRNLDDGQAFRRLRSLCLAGMNRRYGGVNPEVLTRLDYELSVIRAKGFSGYFLVVHDITSRFGRTCGRGSSASSIVSYLLGITHVDPLAHRLFFERFLNMERKDPPDIDVDFPWDEREKALQYVFKTYGDRAALVADHVSFRLRSSLREGARAFGLEEEEIRRIVHDAEGGNITAVPDYLRRAGMRLSGMPRHLGTHPGGVVITPGPMTDYSPVEISPAGFPVIAWEKDGAEDAGLVKIDLLGNRSLAVLRDTLELVNLQREAPLDWETFSPLKDRRTRHMIERGDTLGVFYVESPATRLLLRKMGRGDYEHLVVAGSIIRPAANRYIDEYLRRLSGEPYRPPHPLVAGVLKETCGIMVYQEDVARVSMAASGFSAGEADELRKLLSRKDREALLPAWKERFIAGARKLGMDDPSAQELWEGILSFDGYSFCKAHSASYALVSYRLAWLKDRYPLEFFTQVINNGGGFYSRQVYINAVRRKGFSILGPDVNHSNLKFTVEEGKLRVGLSQLKGIRLECLSDLLESRRKDGPFRDIEDFARRVPASFADLRVLIRSGCFDSVAGGRSRPELFWVYYHRERNASFFLPPPPPALGEYPPEIRLADEVKTLDLVIS
ncbi:MAG: DNA polymerase III subunit alpha, partial [Spirochaetales bacterium]|nr:DNA polymerase III subunit alpha [Spirochaetales bacterium]